jgi:hypothetical protein
VDRQIRKLGIALTLLFGVLFAQMAYVQVIAANRIKNDPANASRQIIAEYRVERGAILSQDGRVLAESVKAKGRTDYLYERTYPNGPLYAAITGFLMSSAQAAPIVAWMTRMARGHWARAVRRPAELFAVAGIVTSVLFVALPGVLPPLQGRTTIWFFWTFGAPTVWDSLSVYFLAFCGLGMLYTWREYESWMQEAGFGNVERRRLLRDHGLIVGTRP